MANFADEDFRVPNIKSTCDPHGWLVCVAVAIGNEKVAVRDTKDLEKRTLVFSRDEWRAFVQAVKAGQYDV